MGCGASNPVAPQEHQTASAPLAAAAKSTEAEAWHSRVSHAVTEALLDGDGTGAEQPGLACSKAALLQRLTEGGVVDKLAGVLAANGALAGQHEEAHHERPVPDTHRSGGSVPEQLLLGLNLSALQSDREQRRTACDGYQYRALIADCAKTDHLSVCERLWRQGSPGVARATVFVSLWLGTTLEARMSVLKRFLEQQKLDPATTYFWICDTSLAQMEDTLEEDIKRLPAIITAVGHTLMLMEPWDKPDALKRVWCVYEVFHTQSQDVRFTIGMRAEQAAAFREALVHQFGSIATSMSRVDIREASAYLPADKRMILAEVEAGVGVSKLNQAVIDLLHTALEQEGSTALAETPEGERFVSPLAVSLATLLKSHGKLEDAEELLCNALDGRRRELGGLHKDTLLVQNHLGHLLHERGRMDEAETLLRDALVGRRRLLGDRHPETLASMNYLGRLLKDTNPDAAEPIYREALSARRELLGNDHVDTLKSINNLATLLHDKLEFDAVEPLYHEALTGRRKLLGDRHPDTLRSVTNLANLLNDRGNYTGAELLHRETLGTRREILGNSHPDTLRSVEGLGIALHDLGEVVAAEEYLREALEARMRLLGNEHPDTLKSGKLLSRNLKEQGRLDEANALLSASALKVQRAQSLKTQLGVLKGMLGTNRWQAVADALFRSRNLDGAGRTTPQVRIKPFEGFDMMLVHAELARDAQVNATEMCAMRLHKAAVEAEPATSALLRAAVAEARGELSGFEFRLKTLSSLEGVLRSHAKRAHLERHDHSLLAECAALVYQRNVFGKIQNEVGHSSKTPRFTVVDALRYTCVFEPADYAEGVEKVRAALAEKGHVPIDLKNFWPGRGFLTYRGINEVRTMPTSLLPSGVLYYEIQMHTRQSFAAKMESHAQYEVFTSAPSVDDRYAAYEAMVVAADAIIVPPDAERLSDTTWLEASWPEDPPGSGVAGRKLTRQWLEDNPPRSDDSSC